MKMCHKMKVYKRGNNGDSRPEIRLLGSWLEKAGFPIGQEICVTVLEDGKIMIEPNYDTSFEISDEQWEEAHKIEKEYYRECEREFERECFDIVKWIINHGGIKKGSYAADTTSLGVKESGYRGRNALVRPSGKPLDLLRDEAEWEGYINPSTSTDEFMTMIENAVNANPTEHKPKKDDLTIRQFNKLVDKGLKKLHQNRIEA